MYTLKKISCSVLLWNSLGVGLFLGFVISEREGMCVCGGAVTCSGKESF